MTERSGRVLEAGACPELPPVDETTARSGSMPYTVEINVPETAAVAAALPAYEIEGELRRGPAGTVIAARHRQLGRPVAIKQLPLPVSTDAELRSRFVAGARVLGTLDHAHILKIYDFLDGEGLCLFVTERLTGGTVRSRFRADGCPPDVSCAILLAVCAGLHYAHQRGVLHCALNPDNLMFTRDGRLKVTDLGIADVVGASDAFGPVTYVAPEQWRGAEVTTATDVYQAGALLMELLTGRPSAREVAHGVPRDLLAASNRATAASPADRYQSAEEFGIAIARAAAATWGPAWLARTNVPVVGSGPMLAAALGEGQASSTARPLVRETVVDDVLPALPAGAAAAEGTGDPKPRTAAPEASVVALRPVTPSRSRGVRRRSRRSRSWMVATAVTLLAAAAVLVAGVAAGLSDGAAGQPRRATPPGATPSTIPAPRTAAGPTTTTTHTLVTAGPRHVRSTVSTTTTAPRTHRHKSPPRATTPRSTTPPPTTPPPTTPPPTTPPPTTPPPTTPPPTTPPPTTPPPTTPPPTTPPPPASPSV